MTVPPVIVPPSRASPSDEPFSVCPELFQVPPISTVPPEFVIEPRLAADTDP